MASDEMNVVFDRGGILSWTTIQTEKLNALRLSGELTVRIVAEGVSEAEAVEICQQQRGMSVGLWVLDQIKNDLSNQDVYFSNALFALRNNSKEQLAMIQTVETFNKAIDGEALARVTISKMMADPENRDYYLELGVMACKYNIQALVVFLETLSSIPHF